MSNECKINNYITIQYIISNQLLIQIIFIKLPIKYSQHINKANHTYLHPPSTVTFWVKCHLSATLIGMNLISTIFLIYLNRESLNNANDDCLMWNYLLKSFAWQSTVLPGFIYSIWCPKWLPEYYISDSMFQPFNYVVVKTGNFLIRYSLMGKKAIKTFMLPKTTIQEV